METMGKLFCSDVSNTMPLLSTERLETIAASAGRVEPSSEMLNKNFNTGETNFFIAFSLWLELRRPRSADRGPNTAWRRAGCLRESLSGCRRDNYPSGAIRRLLR